MQPLRTAPPRSVPDVVLTCAFTRADRDTPTPRSNAVSVTNSVSGIARLRRTAGFTLLEMLIVAAIIAVIVAIAYPAYTSHIAKTARSDGMAALMDTAQIMERCFTQRNTYDNADCHDLIDNYASPRGLYAVDLTQVDDNTFTLEATPQGVQLARDGNRCSALRYDHTGARTATGSLGNQCWN